MVALTDGLTDTNRLTSPHYAFGYDSGAIYRASNKILAAAGVSHDDFYTCKTCKGTGLTAETQAAHAAWKDYEPPEGPGWQLWETVSEGSPVSPVFKTPEALAEWSAERASLMAGEKVTKEEWLALILSEKVDVASFGVMHQTSEGVRMGSAKDIVLGHKS
jgi:hypothetical protein